MTLQQAFDGIANAGRSRRRKGVKPSVQAPLAIDEVLLKVPARRGRMSTVLAFVG